MAGRLVLVGIAILVASTTVVYCCWPMEWTFPDTEPRELVSKQERDLGNGIVGQLANALNEQRVMELAEEWGFEPDREITVSSRAGLGEFARYAPSSIDKLGWSGTAFIQGKFGGHPENTQYMPGILVYKLDDGPVIWIHATEAWLDQQEHSGRWLFKQDVHSYPGVAEEIRAVITQNLSPGADIMVYGLGSWGMKGIVGSVELRLVYPFKLGDNIAASRYDIWLKRSRVKELQVRPR